MLICLKALNFIAGLYDSQELPAEVKPVFKRIVLEHGAVSFSTDALRLLCIVGHLQPWTILELT